MTTDKTSQMANLFDPARLPPRDSSGFTMHPDLPQFIEGEDEGVMDANLFTREGLETDFVEFESDAPEALRDRWYDDEGGECTEWVPTTPQGDGWLLAGIWDTEDGPIAYFVRPLDMGASA